MKTRIWLGLATIYLVWGSTYLAIRFAVETIPPFLLAAARFLIAGLLLYAWRRWSGDGPPTRRHWRSAAVIGLLLLAGGNGGVTWSETRVTSGVAALLIGSLPLWMVLLDAIWPGGQRPNLLTLLGVVVGFAGILLLVGPGEAGGDALSVDVLGAGGVLLASFLWAIGSLYSRKAELPDSPLLGSSMEMLSGGVALLVLGTLSGEWGRLELASIAPRSVAGLMYLVVFGTLIGFATYTWLLRVAPTPLVATYAYVNPLIAVLLGAVLASEPLTPRLLMAGTVIVGAVVLINLARRRRLPQPAEPPVASPAVTVEAGCGAPCE